MKWVLLAGLLVEAYYWIVYVPRAWKNPGTNRDIDDLRDCHRRINLFTGRPRGRDER